MQRILLRLFEWICVEIMFPTFHIVTFEIYNTITKVKEGEVNLRLQSFQ